jgi:hypothetical protein
MGNSDPLPAGFEIRFGSLNFQATGNGYLMRITNRDELRARWPTGPGPAPTAPVADALVSAHADAAGPPAPRHRQRSGQRSRKAQTERRWAARVTSQRNTIASETTTAPTRGGGGAISGPRFPLGLHGTTVAHAASIDTVAREGRPGHRVSAAGNPAITTDDESYHGSTSELPPATSHGYAEWDLSVRNVVPTLTSNER